MTSATHNHCWTRSAFHRANVAARASAVNGCLPTRATTPKRYAATATNIECTRHSAAFDEAQAQAWPTQTVRPAQIPTAQHHRTHVWLAEREPPNRHTLRQAREKLCRNGLAGLCHAVYATAFFRQSLRPCLR